MRESREAVGKRGEEKCDGDDQGGEGHGSRDGGGLGQGGSLSPPVCSVEFPWFPPSRFDSPREFADAEGAKRGEEDPSHA